MSDMEALAEEYRISAKKCKERIAELQEELAHKQFGASDIRNIKKRIITLEIMASDCAGMASVLSRYYDNDTTIRPRGGTFGISIDEH